MLFRAWYRYRPLTRADIRNPDSEALNYYHPLIRFIPAVFLLSNDFRKENNIEIYFLHPEDSQIVLFRIVFVGEKLRYLSPDWLSSGALLVKAFKKYEKNSLSSQRKEVLFVNPGVYVYLSNHESIENFEFSKPIFVEGSFLELEKFNAFLNTASFTEKLGLDFVSKDVYSEFFQDLETIFIESFSQTITIINFSIDNYFTSEGKESGSKHD